MTPHDAPAKPQTAVLTCALADAAPFVVKEANFDHCCEFCQGRVVVSPASLRLMAERQDLDIHILCIWCGEALLALQRATGHAPEEIHPAPVRRKDLVPNPWRERN